MDDVTIMKLDAIKISDRRPARSTGALRNLQHRLKKFFNEADGHGSLFRKPPPTLITPRYFRIDVALSSCYPINRMNWLGFVNSKNFKKIVPQKEEEDRQKAAQKKRADSWDHERRTNK